MHLDRFFELQQVPVPHGGGQGEVGKEGTTEGGLVESGPLRNFSQEELHNQEQFGHIPAKTNGNARVPPAAAAAAAAGGGGGGGGVV